MVGLQVREVVIVVNGAWSPGIFSVIFIDVGIPAAGICSQGAIKGPDEATS